MNRQCSQCNTWTNDYSSNQWRKGVGIAKCRNCTTAGCHTYECQECYRKFDSPNQLKMHMQTHRPRTVACLACHEARFRSGANAVQHIESGHCSACRGQSNAREQVYKFVGAQRSLRRYMTDVPLLTYDGYHGNNVPDFPYLCPECTKCFRHCSQLLQHLENKHGHRLRSIGN